MLCGVRKSIKVKGAEAGHAQVGSEPTEMGINDKTGLAEKLRAKAPEPRDVNGLEDEIDARSRADWNGKRLERGKGK